LVVVDVYHDVETETLQQSGEVVGQLLVNKIIRVD